jgi:hypothetical protein
MLGNLKNPSIKPYSDLIQADPCTVFACCTSLALAAPVALPEETHPMSHDYHLSPDVWGLREHK